jgi:hypothetical protein
VTREQIASVLGRLCVSTGGKGKRQMLGPDWEIGMFEAADLNTQRPHTLTLTYRGGGRWRSQTVELDPDRDTFTKTRKMWIRNCVWRLTPEAIEKYAAQIEKAMRDVAERQTRYRVSLVCSCNNDLAYGYGPTEADAAAVAEAEFRRRHGHQAQWIERIVEHAVPHGNGGSHYEEV